MLETGDTLPSGDVIRVRIGDEGNLVSRGIVLLVRPAWGLPLAILPPDAFVLTDTTLRGPILFLQNHEGLRHDVRVGEALLQPFHERWQPNPDEFRQMVREGRLFSLVGDGEYLCANRWIGDEFRFRPVGPIFQVVQRNRGNEQEM